MGQDARRSRHCPDKQLLNKLVRPESSAGSRDARVKLPHSPVLGCRPEEMRIQRFHCHVLLTDDGPKSSKDTSFGHKQGRRLHCGSQTVLPACH